MFWPHPFILYILCCPRVVRISLYIYTRFKKIGGRKKKESNENGGKSRRWLGWKKTGKDKKKKGGGAFDRQEM